MVLMASMMAENSSKQTNVIKEIRVALGLTQEEMARRLGCSSMTARRCEYEARLPTTRAVLNNLDLLAKEANVAIDKEFFNSK